MLLQVHSLMKRFIMFRWEDAGYFFPTGEETLALYITRVMPVLEQVEIVFLVAMVWLQVG
jgi:hypothetical protein